MNEQIHLFTLQLREHLDGLREVSVQGRWDGPAPASLPRAVIATRLLAGSSELLGVGALRDWLTVLLDLLHWIAGNPHGALACYEPVLREIVAFEESLLEGLDAGHEPTELIDAERVARLHQGFAAAAREAASARVRAAKGAPPVSRPGTEPAAVRLEGLDDPRAAVGWETFLGIVERLVTKVPHCPPDGDDEARQERARRQARWRRVRTLGDALFETDDPGDHAPAGGGPREMALSLPELPGGDLFRAALAAGLGEGLDIAGRRPADVAAEGPPWLLRWRLPGLTDNGLPPGAPGVDALFPAAEQQRCGRLLGLIATDLCLATGPASPRWLLLAEPGPERVSVELWRGPGRLPAEVARSLAHLLEEDFLIEAPNLRAALRRLRDEGALVRARFDARGEGRLQVVLPLRGEGAREVCVLPLGGAEVAVPAHLVEAVVTAQGWDRRGDRDGDTVVSGTQRLLAVDLAVWVEGLLPASAADAGGHLALVGLVEKRVALLTAGPARRARVARDAPTPPGWAAVAAGGVVLTDGAVVPLLDMERLLDLRLRRADPPDGAGDAAADPTPSRLAATPADPATSAGESAPARRILLLVASRFRTADLQERLTGAGYVVTACGEPEQARASLRGEKPDAIVCDNAEPTRCLETLLALLARDGGSAPAPIILVAGSVGEGARRLARRLGATGVWTPPYLLDELRPQLG